MHFTGNESNGIYNQYCPLNYCMSGKRPWALLKTLMHSVTLTMLGGCVGVVGRTTVLPLDRLNALHVQIIILLHSLCYLQQLVLCFVFIILSLNITLTQGLINGLIFYANIIQSYKSILYPIRPFSVLQEHSLSRCRKFKLWHLLSNIYCMDELGLWNWIML